MGLMRRWRHVLTGISGVKKENHLCCRVNEGAGISPVCCSVIRMWDIVALGVQTEVNTVQMLTRIRHQLTVYPRGKKEESKILIRILKNSSNIFPQCTFLQRACHRTVKML